MTEQTQTQPTDNPSVTMQDLAMVVRIIDLAVERGGFKGNEASTVGTVRDRIATFVAANTKTEEAAAPAEESPAA